TVAWGVYSVVNEQLAHVDEICSTALDIALAQRMARRGDTVVVTAGVPFGRPGSTNMLRIETVAPPLGGL
ncbi:pyruvate kinase, partial [Pseudomonas aeruginosa]